MSTNQEGEAVVNKNKKYRKDKPWDDPSIDHWKVEPIQPEEVHPFLEESSFSILFPQYREKYIQECQGIIKKRLMEAGIKFEVDLLKGSMTVRTTKKTWDPYSIIKARDVIKLISRSVPYQQALRVMDDNTTSEVIKIRYSRRYAGHTSATRKGS
jgi:ribosomal RNA assembly protein